MADLTEVEAGSCPGCGWHESIIDGGTFSPVDRVCPVCAGKARWDRVLQHDDELERDRTKNTPPGTPLAADGRWTTMTLLAPDEVEQHRGGSDGDTP